MPQTQIIALMFHKVNDTNSNLDPEQFARYLDYLVQHFPIVLPGEPPPEVRVVVCLTFDDAYYDFYHYVYPLLQKHQIKALLAVSVKYIVNETTLSSDVRLSVPYPQGMDEITCVQKVPFCTWQELREMVQSQHVEIASHGFAHANLQDKTTHVIEEIIHSKKRLEEMLEVPIKYFVYPYGKMTRAVHRKVSEVYDYGIRIGSSLNHGWGHRGRLIYRIDAEKLWPYHQPITEKLIRKLNFKYWMNRIRFV